LNLPSQVPQHALYAGTSGWAYPTWKPDFYPAKLPAAKFLEHYASRLNTVEVNYTFRKLATETQLKKWLAATPPDFRFSFKAPQSITHIRRLRDCGDELAKFVESLRPVVKAGKQAALLFQFPPNFRAGSLGKDMQANQQAFADFLKDAGALLGREEWRGAVEFRDASWFTEMTYDALRAAKVALCEAESDDLATPNERTADYLYTRMRCSTYTESRLSGAFQRLYSESRQGPCFVYFMHEEEPHGPQRAENLLKRII
jgi:uncharacterized protein YecE (DUF72 family)